MLCWIIIKVSLKSLYSNKMRSFLAVLGIIIGVAAVISMLALGAGAQQQVVERISALGKNFLVIRPAQRGSQGVITGLQQNLTLEDAKAILEGISQVEEVSPVVRGSAQLKYMQKNTRTNIIGAAITYFTIHNFEIDEGRCFTEQEVEKMARVVILGPVTAKNLFEHEPPINQNIKIKGINFKVVGILKSKGDQGWFNLDDQAIIPYTNAMKQLFGLTSLQGIDVQLAENSNMEEVQQSISSLLRQKHRLQPGIPDDFEIRTQAELLATASNITRTFTILLGGIASISLLVGGIGIMNIMLVSVTERTREIGVRKAIGAKNRDILLQFLIEAIIMSALGGFAGVFLGIGGARLIGSLTQFPTLVLPGSILLAFTFSAGVGIFFGYYPAHRAACLEPIEALRYE